MKLIIALFAAAWCMMISIHADAQIGKVGINTTAPAAMLHVMDSSVVFTGPVTLPSPPGNPPVSGAGTRMMWYADKAAFRAGQVTNTRWDKDSIGTRSVAMGYNTKASGTESLAVGSETTASGYSSTAMGYATKASNFASTALGGYTNSAGIYSTALGFRTKANPFASVTLGQFNDTSYISSGTWQLADPVFIIGNGTSNNARSNAFTVLKNGKTGINTETPLYGLHVVGNDTNDGGWVDGVVIENTGTTGEAALSIRNTTMPSTREWHIGLNQNPNFAISYGAGFSGANTRMLIDTIGQVGIGTTVPGAKLEVNGTSILGVNGTVVTEIIKAVVNLDVTVVGANNSLLQSFGVPNCAIGSTVYISPSLMLSDGLVIACARVGFPGEVQVKFTNTTGSAINPPVMDYYITVIR